MNLDKNIFCIDSEKTLLDALSKLNSIPDSINVSRLILFVHNNYQLIGSLTDGDIRRALLKYHDLGLKVEDICNKNCQFIENKNDYLNFAKFRKKGIKILPILDDARTIISLIDIDITKSQLPLECVVMAGGRGKRLSPLTDNTPKPMLPIDGKPILVHNIDRMINYGIKKFHISIGYLGEQIENYFIKRSYEGIEINFVREEKPLGTAGALSLIKKFDTEKILVINGDLLTNLEYEEFYLSSTNEDAEMAIASYQYKVDIPYAVLEGSSDCVSSFSEKPTYFYSANAGIYILNNESIKRIPYNQSYNMTDLIDEILKDEGKIVHHNIKGYWIDIGKPKDYENAQKIFNNEMS